MSSERENHKHSQELQQIKAIQKAYRDRRNEWHNISFKGLWDTLASLDDEIAQTEPDLIAKVQAREKRINFYEYHLSDSGDIPTDDPAFTKRIKDVLQMHRANRDSLLAFAAEHKGPQWEARKGMWEKIHALRNREQWLREVEIPKLAALLPPPKPIENKIDDDDGDFLEWIESQQTDADRRQEEINAIYQQHEDERDWAELDKDEMELQLSNELTEAKQEAAIIEAAKNDYAKRLETSYAQELVIQDLREKFEEQSTAFAKVEAEFNQKTRELDRYSDILQELNGLVKRADDDCNEALQSYVDKYNVDLEFWDHDIYDAQFQVEVVQTFEPIDQIGFSELIQHLDDLAGQRANLENELNGMNPITKAERDDLNIRYNNAKEMLTHYKSELEKHVAMRAAEIRQALPLFDGPASTSVTVKGVSGKASVGPLTASANANVQAIPKGYMGYTVPPKVPGDIPSSTLDAGDKPVTAEVEELQNMLAAANANIAEVNKKAEAYRTKAEELEFTKKVYDSRQVFKFLGKEELEKRKGVPPYIRARDALNELEDNHGGVKGRGFDLRFLNDKKSRKKVQNMIALRLGVEHTHNPIPIVITSRMDNTGNKVGCKFIINGREIEGIAMIYVGDAEGKDIRTWYLASVGHIGDDLWELCEDSVSPGIKQENRQPLSYFIEMHQKITDEFEKKKKASA